MKKFVLDCSVTISWCFSDEYQTDVSKILYSFENAEAIVPYIWIYEVCNVLTIAERKQRISLADATRFISILRKLPIIYDDKTNVMNDVFILAKHHKISAYDAAYIELAMRLNIPLATLDKGIIEVLKNTDIDRYL